MITSDDLEIGERNAEGTYDLDQVEETWEEYQARCQRADEEELPLYAAELVRQQHAEDLQRYRDLRNEGYSEYQSRLWAGLCDPSE